MLSPNLLQFTEQLRMQRLGHLDIVFAYGDADDMKDAMASWVEDIDGCGGSFKPPPDGPAASSALERITVDQIATEALKRNKRRYQIVFSAADFGALLAAVAAGLVYAADATTGSDESRI